MTSINFKTLDDVVAVLREGNAVITLVKGGRFQLLNIPLVHSRH